MPADYFLELDGIKGESKDSKHKDTIELESWSWGVSMPRVATGGGGGAGKAVFQDFHFTSRLSIASPTLFLSCATGQHIKKATLFVRKSGGDQQDYYQISMADLLVSSFQQGSSEGADTAPVDSFSLNFAKIELEYRPQREDGQLDGPVKAGYDLKANQKV